MLVHPEPVPVLVADGPEDPGRIVDEREVVQDADPLLLEIGSASEGIDEEPVLVALQRDRHRIDREVAAEQILTDRGVLNRGQRRRRVVELRPRSDDVHALAVAVDDHRRAELLMGADTPAQGVRERLRERDRVPLDGDVDVEAGFAEQDVPHCAADEVNAVVGLAQRGDCFEDRSEPLEPGELVRKRDARTPDRRGPLSKRFEDVAAGDDAGELPFPDDRDSVVACGQ